jgi:hypothetical protein
MVPLIREISNVEVAVTVTVRSSVLVVVVDIVPLTGGSRVELVVTEVIVDVSGNNGVVEDVIVPWTESLPVPVAVVPLEIPGMVTETVIVKEPTSVKETTAPVVATGTSVTFEVDVPSLTLTWTTLAVTVASGALGNR